MEVRFVPSRPWEHFPGLFAQKFGSMYPREENTGFDQIPQGFRDADPLFAHQPYRRQIGEHFSLQAGPRMFGLVTKRHSYPGWNAFWAAMAEVLEGVQTMGIVSEVVRLGLRYTNVFDFDIFTQLTLGLHACGGPLQNSQTGISTVFVQGQFSHLLQINNAAMVVGADNKLQQGSILDIDTSLNVTMPDFFPQAEVLFRQAHEAEKRLFFGLLKSEYVVNNLNPEY